MEATVTLVSAIVTLAKASVTVTDVVTLWLFEAVMLCETKAQVRGLVKVEQGGRRSALAYISHHLTKIRLGLAM